MKVPLTVVKTKKRVKILMKKRWTLMTLCPKSISASGAGSINLSNGDSERSLWKHQHFSVNLTNAKACFELALDFFEFRILDTI